MRDCGQKIRQTENKINFFVFRVKPQLLDSAQEKSFLFALIAYYNYFSVMYGTY